MKLYVKRVWLAVLLAGLGVMTGAVAESTPLNIPVCEKPPVLDGKLDDSAWQKATKISKLYRINSNVPAPETTLWLMRDNTWLYISAYCRNPQMAKLTPTAHKHDGPVSKDDSLEIFIHPTSNENDHYYHFMLNFANVGKEQRCNKNGLRGTSWNPPWRTITQQQADGWTAEIAIPLFALESNDLSGMKINLCRNLTTIEQNKPNTKKNQKQAWHILQPDSTGGYHDFANFCSVTGLGGIKPGIDIFAPQVVTATVTGIREEAGKKIYDLKVILDLATPKSGTVQLQVLEDFGKGEIEAFSQSVDLKDRKELELKIPAGDLQAREVKVVLRNPDNGIQLAKRELIKTDLAKDVIFKHKQPFFRNPTAPKVRTATFVVAAADSPEHLKKQADFICSGRDDHVVINAAIKNLPTDGGRVHLTAGTFNIGGVKGTYGGISIFRSNVLLTGEGSGTRLILQDGLTDINVIWIKGNVQDITVRDLFINGNGRKQVPWVRARSGWKGGNGVKAIDRSAFGPTPRNIRVENCHIENCQLMAVMMTGNAVEVLNCYFTGNFGSHVIELLGESGRIEGCTLRVKKGERAGFGFSTDASYQYHIINNKIFIDAGGRIGHPINNWPAKRYGKKINLYHGIIAGNIVINNGNARPVLIDGYMDLVHNNIFRGAPVVLGGPEGGMGIIFEHNMLINSPLEINCPLQGDDCRILINGNTFFNSSVKHKAGNVIWGKNPGYVTENAGTATIAGNQTSVVVAHGLAAAATTVNVTPTNSMGAATKFWVDGKTERNFTIRVDTAPGKTSATFNWQATTTGEKTIGSTSKSSK